MEGAVDIVYTVLFQGQYRLIKCLSVITFCFSTDDYSPSITKLGAPATARELSARGQVFADDIGLVLNADKTLLNNKNADNVLQEAIWSLSQASVTTTTTASAGKSSLREVEGEVQQGKRDQWGRDKAVLEQEQDPKVAWEHGVDSLKNAGSTAIGGYQSAKEGIQAGQDKLDSELKDAYYSVLSFS